VKVSNFIKNKSMNVSAIGENLKSMFCQPSQIKNVQNPFKPMLKSCRRHHLTVGFNRRIQLFGIKFEI
jgi:hypothetical protein